MWPDVGVRRIKPVFVVKSALHCNVCAYIVQHSVCGGANQVLFIVLCGGSISRGVGLGWSMLFVKLGRS